MPVFNEADNIAAAIDDVARHVLTTVPESNLIVVDDGSTDETATILAASSADDPRMTVVRQSNAGHGAALLTGLDVATGDFVLLLDSDRQIRLDDFPVHWRDMTEEKLDGLLGVRAPRRDPRHRRLVSAMMRLLIRCLFRKAPVDAGAPYKIVKRLDFVQLRMRLRRCTTVPSVLLAIDLANRPNLHIAQVPVSHRARVSGRSTLNLSRLAQTGWLAALEITDMRGLAGALRRRQGPVPLQPGAAMSDADD